jgi:hypothetical protein
VKSVHCIASVHPPLRVINGIRWLQAVIQYATPEKSHLTWVKGDYNYYMYNTAPEVCGRLF